MGKKARPSYLGNGAGKEKRRRRVKMSQSQETRVAGMASGRRVRGSGSKPHARGDARWDKFGILLECKRTEKKSISIKGEVLDKIVAEAFANGKTPALAIEVDGKDWVAMPADVVVRICEKALERVEGENGSCVDGIL